MLLRDQFRNYPTCIRVCSFWFRASLVRFERFCYAYRVIGAYTFLTLTRLLDGLENNKVGVAVPLAASLHCADFHCENGRHACI